MLTAVEGDHKKNVPRGVAVAYLVWYSSRSSELCLVGSDQPPYTAAAVSGLVPQPAAGHVYADDIRLSMINRLSGDFLKAIPYKRRETGLPRTATGAANGDRASAHQHVQV